MQGLQFMHKHRVAHRCVTHNLMARDLLIIAPRSDCHRLNVMMDGAMYPHGWHTANDELKRDWTSYSRGEVYTRTERPPKYYLIDFGISRRYDPAEGSPLEDPINGGDKTAPEFQGRKAIIPCDPFPTDVYYIGNLIRTQFLQVRY